jgi:hypothetical protein
MLCISCGAEMRIVRIERDREGGQIRAPEAGIRPLSQTERRLAFSGDTATSPVEYRLALASLSSAAKQPVRTHQRLRAQYRRALFASRLIVGPVRRRSAHVPDGKRESAGALSRGIRSGLLGGQWERSKEFSGRNCIPAANQLAGVEPATFDCPIDSRFGDTHGSCRAVWGVHRATWTLH